MEVFGYDLGNIDVKEYIEVEMVKDLVMLGLAQIMGVAMFIYTLQFNEIGFWTKLIGATPLYLSGAVLGTFLMKTLYLEVIDEKLAYVLEEFWRTDVEPNFELEPTTDRGETLAIMLGEPETEERTRDGGEGEGSR